EKLKQLLEAEPHDSFHNHALALEYIKVGDDMLARKLFEDLLARDPGYIGTYYHLAKLLERAGDIEEAISVYEIGMECARIAGDQHSFGELKSAYEELIF